jgi:hypothetical protein
MHNSPKEKTMPVLPSGRRVDFSVDRFHALLGQMELERAFVIAEALQDPDDLLFVMDAVHYCQESGQPYFADYVAADWESRASDWSQADQDALRIWLAGDAARFHRAEAISNIKLLLLELAMEQTSQPLAA